MPDIRNSELPRPFSHIGRNDWHSADSSPAKKEVINANWSGRIFARFINDETKLLIGARFPVANGMLFIPQFTNSPKIPMTDMRRKVVKYPILTIAHPANIIPEIFPASLKLWTLPNIAEDSLDIRLAYDCDVGQKIAREVPSKIWKTTNVKKPKWK